MLFVEKSFLLLSATSRLSSINSLEVRGLCLPSPLLYASIHTGLIIKVLKCDQASLSMFFFIFKSLLAILGHLHLNIHLRIHLLGRVETAEGGGEDWGGGRGGGKRQKTVCEQ